MFSNSKFLFKNILTSSALTAAMIVTSGNAFGVIKDTAAPISLFSNGATWVGGVAPADNDSIRLTPNNVNITADVVRTIKQLNVNGQINGSTNDGLTTVLENLKLGSVIDNNTSNVLHALSVTSGKSVTLTGAAENSADVNSYRNLSGVELAPNALAIFKTDNSAPLTFDSIVTFADATSAINVQTEVITPNADEGSLLGNAGGASGTVNIGTTTTASKLTSLPEDIAVTINNLTTFQNTDSALALDSSKLGNTGTWTLDGVNLGSALSADGSGVLLLNAQGNKIRINNTNNETIGANATHSLKKFTITGDNDVTINPLAYVKGVDQSSTAGLVSWGEVLDLGDAGAYTLLANRDTTLEFTNSMVKGNILASALNGKTLTINGMLGDNAGAPIALLSAPNANRIVLEQESNIGFLTFANSNPSAVLEINDDVKIGITVHPDSSGILNVNHTATLLEGTAVSLADNPLKAVTIADGVILNLGNNVDLYTTDGFSGTNNNSAIIATGNSILSGKVGTATEPLSALGIDSATADATLKILGAVYATTIDTAQAGNTLQFANNVTADHLNGVLNGGGVVEFINPAPITITINQPGINTAQFEAIKFSGTGNVSVSQLNTTSLVFGTQASTVSLLPGTTLNGIEVTTTSTTQNQNIVLSEDTTVDSPVGSEANKFGSFVLAADVTLTVDAPFYTNVATTLSNGQGQLVLNQEDAGVQSIGSASNPLKLVTVNADNGFDKDVYAVKLAVVDNVTTGFNGKISNGTVELQGLNATSVFSENSVLNSTITTLNDGQGNAAFLGGSKITKNLGASDKKLQNVAFTDDTGSEVQSIKANIYAENVALDKTTFSVDQANVVLSDNVAANNTTFSLNNNQLAVGGILTVNGEPVLKTSFIDNKLGTLELSSADSGFITNGVNVAVKLEDFGNLIPSTTPVFYPLISADSDANPDNLDIDEDTFDNITLPANSLNAWQFVNDGTRVGFLGFNNSAAVIKSALDTADASPAAYEAASAIFNPANTSYALANELSDVRNASSAAFIAALEKAGSAVNTSALLLEVNNRAQATVIKRAVELQPGSIRGMTKEHQLVVGAGDEQKYARYGAWGAPFYSQSTQKRTGSMNGYKAKSYGGTLGYDTMANDTMTIGVAVTYAGTKVDHRDVFASDRTRINSYLLSFYGTQLVCDDYFVTGIASMGSSKIKNHFSRVGFENGAIVNRTANSSHNAMSFSGELLAGYHYQAHKDVVAIPTLGLSYNMFNETGYTETGTTNQNYTVTTKKHQKVEVIAGVKVISGREMNGLAYTPEAHAYVRHSINNKAPSTQFRLNGMIDPINASAGKGARTNANVGLSLTLQSGMFDYSAGYDFDFAKKYTAHQGVLKVRVNF